MPRFPKSCRLCSRILINKLFEPGNSRSFTAYPMRLIVYTQEADNSQLLISVPKRLFRHAVDRNRVKRQIREAYRNNSDILTLPNGCGAVMAIIWLDGHHHTSVKVTAKVRNLLQRVSESLCGQ